MAKTVGFAVLLKARLECLVRVKFEYMLEILLHAGLHEGLFEQCLLNALLLLVSNVFSDQRRKFWTVWFQVLHVLHAVNSNYTLIAHFPAITISNQLHFYSHVNDLIK